MVVEALHYGELVSFCLSCLFMALTLLRRMSLDICFFFFCCPYLKPSGDKQLQRQKPWLWLWLRLWLQLSHIREAAFAFAFCLWLGQRLFFWRCVLRRRTAFSVVLLGLVVRFLLFAAGCRGGLDPTICHIYFVFIENNSWVSERSNGWLKKCLIERTTALSSSAWHLQ